VARFLHPERALGLDRRLVVLFQQMAEAMPFDIMITPEGGIRFPYQQRRLYAQGRTTPGPIVTFAEHPEDAPHCHAGAGDCVPVFEDGKIHWSADDPLFPEYLRRQKLMGAFARDRGFTWGGDWAKFKDWDHFEVKDWHSLPVAEDPPGAPI
jgi:peptidoglycan L-alanyl-D-glutamate endopeptidase CwlK